MSSISFVSEDDDFVNENEQKKKLHDDDIHEKLTQATSKLVSVQNEIEIRIKEKELTEKAFEEMVRERSNQIDRGYLFQNLQYRPPTREVKGETEIIMEKINRNLRKFFKETEEMVDDAHYFIKEMLNIEENDFSKGNFNSVGIKYAEKKNDEIRKLTAAEKIQAKYAKSNDDEKNVLDERFFNVYYESFRLYKGMTFLDLKKSAVSFWNLERKFQGTSVSSTAYWNYYDFLDEDFIVINENDEIERFFQGKRLNGLKYGEVIMRMKPKNFDSYLSLKLENEKIEVRKLKKNTEAELASELYKQMPALKNYIEIIPEPEDRRELKEKKMRIDDKNCLVMAATIFYLVLFPLF